MTARRRRRKRRRRRRWSRRRRGGIFIGFPLFFQGKRNVQMVPDSGHHGGRGTQDTDLNKGIVGRNFTKFLRRRKPGGRGRGQGQSDPLI